MRKVRLMRRFAGWWDKQAIGDCEFAIISNNCWGYQLYNDLDRNYNTPFVGLFVLPGCYLALLADFEKSISGEIDMGYRSAHRPGELSYPVGTLPGGAEIHFLHYREIADAQEKWQRRCERLRESIAAGVPLFLKMCDFDGTTDEQFRIFHGFDLGARVSFSPRALPIPGHIGMRSLDYRATGRVGSGTWLYDKRNRWFDVAAWIRNGSIRRTPRSILLSLVT